MATQVVAAEGTAAQVVSQAKPFRPSIVDWIVGAIERLPGPTWLAYVGVSLLALLFLSAEAITSGLTFNESTATRFGYAFFYVFPLAAYHYLSIGARQAWAQFRPSTNLDDETSARIAQELSSTPFTPVLVIWLVVGLLTVLSYASTPADFDLVGYPPLHVALRVVSESFWIGPVMLFLVYLVVRQVRIISRLHRTVEHVDLLRPGPMHAMSRLTARSAIALVVVAVFTGLPFPGTTDQALVATVLLFSLPLLVVAGATFVLPLRGMNSRLVYEKSRLMGEISVRIEATSEALHELVDRESVNSNDADASRAAQTRIDALTKALAGLFQEREFVKKQSTWPWDPSTGRAVVSALALPIVLFLITRFLDRVI